MLSKYFHKRVRLCMSCAVGVSIMGLSGRTVSCMFSRSRKYCLPQRRKGLNSEFKTTLQMLVAVSSLVNELFLHAGRAWRALTFKVFNGLCSSVTSLRLATEHVSRRGAEEPRCFLLWIQVHPSSQNICKARSAAFRCHTLLTGVLEKPPRKLAGHHHSQSTCKNHS